jgi:hypothetical protein
MLLRTLPCCKTGNTIIFGLAGVFVSTVVAAAHIIYHTRIYAIGINGSLWQFLYFLHAQNSRQITAKGAGMIFFIYG